MEAIDSRAGVETTIEAQDAVDPGRAHHGHVKGVPCGEAVHRFHERFGGADLGHAEGQDVVDSRIETRKRGVDGAKLSNRCVAMKYLLVDLHVRRKRSPSRTSRVSTASGRSLFGCGAPTKHIGTLE